MHLHVNYSNLNPPKPKIININIKNIDVGNALTFSLKSTDGIPLKGEKVNIIIGKKSYNNKKLNNNGAFTIKKKLLKKPTKITVTFKPTKKYNGKSVKAYVFTMVKLTGLSSSCKYNDKISLSINVKKLKVNVLVDGKKKSKISFKYKKAKLDIKSLGLKKGKKYKLKFESTSNYYHLNEKSYSIKVNK